MGKTVQDAKALLPEHRLSSQRICRGDKILEPTSDTVIQVSD
jgi:hypothetical protein